MLSLYPSILAPILSEWILDIDLCALDTAVCSAKLRQLFLNTLAKVTVSCTAHYHGEQYEWMLMRSVKPRDVFLPSTLSALASTSLANILAGMNQLHSLETFIDPIPFLGSIKLVNKLQICERMEESVLKMLLSSVSVRNLSFVTCNIGKELDNILVTLCPSLRSIEAPLSVSVLQMAEVCDLDSISCTTDQLNLSKNLLGCYCTMHKVTDTSGVSIGGKYYHMKHLKINKTFIEEETELIHNYAKHLESLCLGKSIKCLDHGNLMKVFASECHPLTIIFFSYITFDEEDFIALVEHSKRLKRVELIRCTSVTDRSVTSLALHCQDLKYFRLLDSVITSNALQVLVKNCTNLETVLIGFKAIPTPLILAVAYSVDCLELSAGVNTVERNTIRGMVTLYCSARMLLPEWPSFLARNPGLQRIRVPNGCMLKDTFLDQLTSKCLQLQHISLSYATTAESLICLKRCRNLTTLQFSEKELTDSLIDCLLEDKPYLTSLLVYACTGYTNAVIKSIVKHCPNLKHIALTYAPEFSSDDMIELLQGCKRIDSLDVEGCQLNSSILPHLTGRRFRQLYLHQCGLPKEEVEEFVRMTDFSCTREFIYT